MRKVVVLFLDGGTWTVIEPLLKAGRLPNLNKLIKKGSRAILRSTVPPLTSFVWPSLLTGKWAGKHGIYNFYSLDEKNNLKLNYESHDTNKFLWDFLTEKGIRSIFLDIPLTYPPKEINGIIISYNPPNLQTDFTFPSDYKIKLLKQFPEYKPSINYRSGENERNKRNFFKEIYNFTESRFKLIDYLLENEQWDLFITDFMFTDVVQHWFWKNMDKSHPYYEKNYSSDYVYNIYQKVDDFICRLEKKLPKDTTFIIASDHGFGKYIQDININKWLQDQGYLVFKNNTGFFKNFFKKLGFTPSNISRLILKLKLGILFKHLNPKFMSNMANKFSLTYENMDMSKTIAYSYGYCGPIYLNKNLLGNKYEEIREEIINKLQLIEDPVYGKKLITKIWKKEELYTGPRSEGLPDIIINMQDFSYGCSSTLAFKSNELFSKPITLKCGEHKVEGFFVISGDGIEKGKNLEIEAIDFLPTLLYIYDCNIPKDLDGKPKIEFLKKNFKSIKR